MKQELIQRATATLFNAYAPYSGYAVGAALLDADGDIFIGCNVENASYGLTVCAERNAIFQAVIQGKRQFKALAIVANGDHMPYPCGACLQVLAEFAEDLPIYMKRVNDDNIVTGSLKDFLPHHFGLS